VSGKLDEELSRMSRIVDRVRPGALVLVLSNEYLWPTNEREVSQIATQVLKAFAAAEVRVDGHMLEFAHRLGWVRERSRFPEPAGRRWAATLPHGARASRRSPATLSRVRGGFRAADVQPAVARHKG
jgi:hypothetical protein